MTDTHLTSITGGGEGDPDDPWIQDNWYFTFGLDHPLAGRFVRLRGTCEGTRELMTAIFGQGNWAQQYDEGRGIDVVVRHKLTRLDLGRLRGGTAGHE
jgi:hypothetical protein